LTRGEFQIASASCITPAVANGASTFFPVRPGAGKRAIRRLAGNCNTPYGYSFTRQANDRRDLHEFGSGV